MGRGVYGATAKPKGQVLKAEELDVLADKAFILFMSALFVTYVLDLHGLGV